MVAAAEEHRHVQSGGPAATSERPVAQAAMHCVPSLVRLAQPRFVPGAFHVVNECTDLVVIAGGNQRGLLRLGQGKEHSTACHDHALHTDGPTLPDSIDA